jgi:hypothetical protein
LRHGCTEIPFMLGEAASRHEASSLVSGKITGAGRGGAGDTGFPASRHEASSLERGGAGDTGSPAEEACMLNPLQLLAEATVRYALS